MFSREIGRRLREAAEPVRADATRLAGQEIKNLGQGDPWAGMRVGGGVTIVYVAPKQKGRASKMNSRIRRPNLGDLLMDRAMKPALERNREQVANKVDSLLGDMERDWGRGG